MIFETPKRKSSPNKRTAETAGTKIAIAPPSYEDRDYIQEKKVERVKDLSSLSRAKLARDTQQKFRNGFTGVKKKRKRIRVNGQSSTAAQFVDQETGYVKISFLSRHRNDED